MRDNFQGLPHHSRCAMLCRMSDDPPGSRRVAAAPLLLLIRVNSLQGWRRLKSIRDQSRLLTGLIAVFIVGYLGLAFWLFWEGLRFVAAFPGLGTQRRPKLLQTAARGEFHAKKRKAVLAFAHLVDRKNVRMIKAGCRVGFAPEAHEHFMRISVII